MAATNKMPGRRENRASAMGKDIFSKMLMMEKETHRHHRNSSASPVSPLSDCTYPGSHARNTSAAGSLSTNQPNDPISPLSSNPPTRSPRLSEHKQMAPLKLDTAPTDGADDASAICHSPTWSDHGEKQRQKTRRQHERDERDAKRQSRQAEQGPPKRLSKKPPAAMDTQKMPSELKRNSIISFISSRSSSRERSRSRSRSRRNSRDDDRASVTSLSSKRSQSTPASSTETHENFTSIVSQVAPKIPSFRWRSRESAPSWQLDDPPDQDFVKFSYKIEAKPVSDASQPPTLPRSTTEPVLSKHATDSSQKSGILTFSNRLRGVPRDPSINATKHRPQLAAASGRATSHVNSPSRSSDGGSYVHKQRMYQQQMSIAGYHDQEAVQKANEMTLADDRLASDKVPGQSATAEKGKILGDKRNESTKTTSSEANTRRATSRSPVDAAPKAPKVASRESSVKARRAGRSAFSENISPIRSNFDTQKDSQASLSASSTSQDGKRDKPAVARQRSKPPNAKVWNTHEEVLGVGEASDRRSRLGDLLVPKIPFRSRRDSAESNRSNQDNAPEVVYDSDQESRSLFGRLLEPRLPFRSRRNSASSAKSSSSSIRGHSRSRAASSENTSEKLALESVPYHTTAGGSSPAESGVRQSSAKTFEFPSKQELARGDAGQQPTNPSRPAKPPIQKSSTVPVVPTTKLDPPATTQKSPDPAKKSTPLLESKELELTITTPSPEGLLRKTSVTRARSNPQLQTQSTATNVLPNLDFLPQLKHQPFAKSPRRHSPSASATNAASTASTSDANSGRTRPIEIALPPPPKSPLRRATPSPPSSPQHSQSTAPALPVSAKDPTVLPRDTIEAKPIAKMFVICCQCRFWHDLPSKLYEAMAMSSGSVSLAAGADAVRDRDQDKNGPASKTLKSVTANGKVKCPWCEHGMSTVCCQGWTGVVYLKERHH